MSSEGPTASPPEADESVGPNMFLFNERRRAAWRILAFGAGWILWGLPGTLRMHRWIASGDVTGAFSSKSCAGPLLLLIGLVVFVYGVIAMARAYYHQPPPI
jgi:hypothetical protein